MNYKSVSKKMMTIRELTAVLCWFLLVLFPLIYLDPLSLWWNLIVLPLTALWLVTALAYIPLSYKKTKYAVTTDKVVYQKGIFFNTRQVMARTRIVTVTLMKSPLTPVFGTAAVIIRATGAIILIRNLTVPAAEAVVQALAFRNEV